MTPRCHVMVGFGKMLLTQLDDELPAGSVVLIEDADIVEKRAVRDDLSRLRCVGGLVSARYHQDLECVQAVEAHLGDRRIDVVLPGLEYGVPAAAELAERFGLPGPGTAAAYRLTDKLRLREAASAAGLRNPEWAEVFSAQDIRDFASGQPVVLKPANRHASLGVQLLEPGDDIDEAWDATLSARDDILLPARELHWRYLAERLIAGREYSAEALVQRGEIVFLNITEKLTAPGRHPVELGHVLPAPLAPDVESEFKIAMVRLAGAVGFRDGLMHAEWMLDEQGLVLVECAGRVPGDSIVDLIDTAYGGHLVLALVAVLAGQAPEVPRAARQMTAIRFLTAVPGRVTAVDGLERARAIRGVVRAQLGVAAGDEVGPLLSSWDRVGEVVAVGRSASEARQRVEEAVAELCVQTAPSAADAGRRAAA